MSRHEDNIGECPICDRGMIKGVFVDEHHLIPKARNGKYGAKITLHRICHEKIHSVWSEKELAGYFHTVDRIRNYPEMETFRDWVKNKPIDFYLKTRMSNRRRR